MPAKINELDQEQDLSCSPLITSWKKIMPQLPQWYVLPQPAVHGASWDWSRTGHPKLFGNSYL